MLVYPHTHTHTHTHTHNHNLHTETFIQADTAITCTLYWHTNIHIMDTIEQLDYQIVKQKCNIHLFTIYFIKICYLEGCQSCCQISECIKSIPSYWIFLQSCCSSRWIGCRNHEARNQRAHCSQVRRHGLFITIHTLNT